MATITNIINTNNKEIDIVCNGGDLKLGSAASSTAITIGNNSGATAVNINSGANNFGVTVFSFNKGIITAPASSNTATTAFGTSLTASVSKQNTLGYDILLNINVVTTGATATNRQLTVGVGPTSPPNLNQGIFTSGTVAIGTPINFAVIVPNNYYVLIDGAGFGTFNNTCVAFPI